MIRGGIDLSKIPAPDALVVVDHAAKVAEMKAKLVAARPDLAPALALASDPLVKLIEAWAYEAILKAGEINAGVRAMLLAHATGADLVNLAANHLVYPREGETESELRARAQLGPEGWSTAGPEGAYRYHALSASAEVADVDVSSPAPGVVRVVVLSHAPDGVASAELLATVDAALNVEEVRPLDDQVVVVSAGVASYDVAAVLKVGSGPDPAPLVAAAETAVRAYAAERRKLGLGVTLDGLKAALMRPGVEAAPMTSPLADIAAVAEVAPVLDQVVITAEVIA